MNTHGSTGASAHPAIYDTDVEEMTAGALGALEEVRRQLVDHYAGTPQIAATITEIIDAYASELVDNVTDEDDLELEPQ